MKLLLERLYNKNYINKINKEQKIPKIIHQVWLGGKIPDKYNFYIDTIKKTNPGWEHKLWTDNDIENFNLKNITLFNNIRNFGSKSDIFRYEILEKFGGIYLDVDFYGVKSFDDLIHLDFFCGGNVGSIFNSLIGTIPNGKIISSIVNELLKIQSFVDNIDGVMNTTGPYCLEREFNKQINDDDNVVVFPTEFFYPFPAGMRHIQEDSQYNKIVNNYNTMNTYCVHMWHTNWQKQI